MKKNKLFYFWILIQILKVPSCAGVLYLIYSDIEKWGDMQCPKMYAVDVSEVRLSSVLVGSNYKLYFIFAKQAWA